MRFASSVLVLCAIVSCVMCDPLWKVFCQNTPVYRGRADPIVDPGKAAQHSHKVFGGSAFDLATSADTNKDAWIAYGDKIEKSSCTTCSITIDNSVYWIPDLYYRWENGSISLVPNGGLTIYYPSRGGSGDQEHPQWQPFPKGFRMVAGQSTRRYFNSSIVEHKAISYACLSEPGGPETGDFPTTTRFCKNGLRAQVWFPMCWNGVDLDSPNHQSHMSYPLGGRPDGGNCPSTHPVRFPGVFFEVLFGVDNFPHGDGVSRFLWSNGDVTGNGLHGDFLNGWNQDILRAAIADPSCDIDNTCIGNCPEKCAPFTPYVKKNNPDQSCQLTTPIVGTEDLGVGHLISHLPGCNPISGGPGPVTACTGSWPQTSVDVKVRVGIRTSNGLYLSNINNTNYWASTVAGNKLSYSEMYTFAPVAGGLWSIQSESTVQFAGDTPSGERPIRFNKGNPSDWEFFNITYINGNGPSAAGTQAYIVSNAGRRYLTLQADGTVQSTTTTPTSASIFYIVDPNAGMQDTRSSTAGFNTPAPPPTSTPTSGGPAVTEAPCDGCGEPYYPDPTTKPSTANPTTKPSTANPTTKPSTAKPSNGPTGSPSDSSDQPSNSTDSPTVRPTITPTNLTDEIVTSSASTVVASAIACVMLIAMIM